MNQDVQRAVMRWPVALDLLPATGPLEAAFRLVTTPVVALFTGELDEVKGELRPMSPGNHVQSPARAACVNAIAAIDVISSVFIGILVMADPKARSCFAATARSRDCLLLLKNQGALPLSR